MKPLKRNEVLHMVGIATGSLERPRMTALRAGSNVVKLAARRAAV